MNRFGTILIVDDDPRMCRLVARYLHREGYSVRTAGSGSEMRRVLVEEDPQLVILDLMLPDEDGFELARFLRARSAAGIIMLTGKTDTVDKVVGLEIGADDYITKPFDERELLARVRSVMRRVSGHRNPPEPGNSVAYFGDWVLDIEGQELRTRTGMIIDITNHEFRLLSILVAHCHRVLTRDAILDSVFDREWSPDDRSIDVLVGKLRKKLGDNARQPRLIKTIRGAGYKLIPSVRFADSDG
jgi:DNA-binding response OmpR family regulator